MDDLKDIIQGVEQRLFTKAIAKRIPIYGNLELTPLCNMNCEMCYVRLSHEEMLSKGRLRTLDDYIRLVDEMREAGVLFIQLTGGEPLLYNGFRPLYLHLLESGFVVTVNTNGILIDDDWADFFAQHPPRRINITLYGADDDIYRTLCHHEGGFTKTVTAIQRLKERGVMLKINYSVTAANRHHLESVLMLATKLGIPINPDTYMCPSVRERSRAYNESARISPQDMAEVDEDIKRMKYKPEAYEEFCARRLEMVKERTHNESTEEQRPMHFNCNAGRCAFIVNWQGKLRPCIMLNEPSVDVFETGFVKGWDIISQASAELTFSPACSTCKLLPLCKVCAAAAILETGNHYDRPYYLCQSAEAVHAILQNNLLGVGES